MNIATVPVGDREAPLFASDADWDAAQATLLEAELSDGLPAAIPTPARLTAMLAGCDPLLSFGAMPPLLGEITAQAVAWCCVIAGCRPAEFPVVLEAAIATLEPEFNLLGIQTTTGTPTVAAVVHGPAGPALGMNAGTNCLGPGNRANACIGRALRLALTNVGGARPLVGDMATMGQPAKYGMAFAEGVHSLATPLHVRHGLDPEEGAVTVIGLSGTLEVLPDDGAAAARGRAAPRTCCDAGRASGVVWRPIPRARRAIPATAAGDGRRYRKGRVGTGSGAGVPAARVRDGLANCSHAQRYPHHHCRRGRGEDDLPRAVGRRNTIGHPAPAGDAGIRLDPIGYQVTVKDRAA